MNRYELKYHADNLYKSLQQEKFKLSRHWIEKMQKEIDRLSRFIYDMDELMGHLNWRVELNVIL